MSAFEYYDDDTTVVYKEATGSSVDRICNALLDNLHQELHPGASQESFGGQKSDAIGDELTQLLVADGDITPELDIALCAYVFCTGADVLNCYSVAARYARFAMCYAMLLELHALGTHRSTLFSIVGSALALLKTFRVICCQTGGDHAGGGGSKTLPPEKTNIPTEPHVTGRQDNKTHDDLMMNPQWPITHRWRDDEQQPQPANGGPTMIVPSIWCFDEDKGHHQNRLLFCESSESEHSSTSRDASSTWQEFRGDNTHWDASPRTAPASGTASYESLRSVGLRLGLAHAKSTFDLFQRTVPFLYLAYIALEDTPPHSIVDVEWVDAGTQVMVSQDIGLRRLLGVIYGRASRDALAVVNSCAELDISMREAKRKYYRFQDFVRSSNRHIQTILHTLNFKLNIHPAEWFTVITKDTLERKQCTSIIQQRCLFFLTATGGVIGNDLAKRFCQQFNMT